MKQNSELVPLLVVRGASHAIGFYRRALGARVLTRYEHGPERHVSHADLGLPEGGLFALTEEARAWNSDAPLSLGGSPVVLQVWTANANEMFDRMCRAGATAVFPVQDLFGERMGRARDPWGHLWIVRQRLIELPAEEIQRQRDELFARYAAPADTPSARAPLRPKAGASLGQVPGLEQARSTRSDRALSCPWGGPRSHGPRAEVPVPEERSHCPGRVHLIIGPVGAGKSTFALRLAGEHAAVRLTLDDWMATLFTPDRPAEGVIDWYVERRDRCIEQIWSVASSIADLGIDVVLEIHLLRRGEREGFYSRVSQAGFELTVHVLDAARDVRRERVMRRNQTQGPTFAMRVPPHIFELASDAWEPPSAEESQGRDLRFHRTDSA